MTELPQTPEWRLQAAAVRRLFTLQKKHPGKFDYAGDMNAARRSPQGAVRAKATGMQAGEPDLRVYVVGARTYFVEFKTTGGRLSAAQRHRHGLLRYLGFEIELLRARTEAEAADKMEALLLSWLAANDNQPPRDKQAARA